jgi:HSP20 family molecular chaperone IbpA
LLENDFLIKNLSKFISKNDPMKKMGLIKHMAKEAMREIGNKSREFYEFVLPPVDMRLEGNNLIVTIDIPGFNKEDIKLSIHRNILSINAEKKEKDDVKNGIICKQRPNVIDKRIRLPIRIKEGEEKVDSAKYIDGVLTIKIHVNNSGKNISID